MRLATTARGDATSKMRRSSGPPRFGIGAKLYVAVDGGMSRSQNPSDLPA
jgi:hypothetical protein